MNELQRLMNARADKIKAQRTLLDAAKAENRDLTAEEITNFDALEAEIDDLDGKIENEKAKMEREQKLQNREKDLENPAFQPFRPSNINTMENHKSEKDNAGFKNIGEFIHAVRFGDSKGRLENLPVGQGQGGGIQVPEAFQSQILPSFRNEQSMGTGSEGGYAVPTQFRPDVMMLDPESAIVRSRAQVIPAGDPPDAAITMPALDQGSSGVYGGVQVQWISEGAQIPDTSTALKEITLQPQEVAASITVTDKLLRNWSAASTFLSNLLTKAMMAAEDIAFLTGNGTGKPTGVIGAAGAKVVNRQTASKITTLDIVTMYAQLYAASQGSAIWVANQSTLPLIASLKDENNNYIFIRGDITKGIPSTLLGVPIIFTGKTSVLGAKGDLALVDLENYLVKDGSGPYIAASEHALFTQNKTIIKVYWNVDGKPWVTEPLKLEDGVTTVSPYVILDVPSA
ncbi:phage major capsid protein [Pullulanibacillus sp. KACC 23026]|uniref:phage major capsid protein n=1 Tax=Pullulanibacillus sp. KACC 23026 TaxID=3028315 RepID=UPI0023B0D1EC|nr:phage major capsid protein [Pullulanibacillus sp. KACC 23026]WEG14149.1 phage major capsid protein [Pullulanibacillus sp. KACC 23026]